MWWDLLLQVCAFYHFIFITKRANNCNDITKYNNAELKFNNNYSLPAAIEPPMITVSSANSSVAGSRYVLICNISLPTGVTVSGVPSVQWRRPSGGSTTGNVFSGGVSGGRSLYISQLIFDPLTLFDGGDYTCTATYSLGGHTSPSGTGTYSLSVISKLVNIAQLKKKMK